MTSSATRGRQWVLHRRPSRTFAAEDLRLVAQADKQLRPGQVRVANLAFSLDPATRRRMDDEPFYVPPFELGRPLSSSAIGRVVESTTPAYAEGSLVFHQAGWRTDAVLNEDVVSKAADDIDPALQLGVLGWTGFSAWLGIHEIARVQPGQSVWISAASGAVGGVAGQLAREAGCRVLGSSSSSSKAEYVRADLGFDACVDTSTQDLEDEVVRWAPEGLDAYFDNVGGEQLNIAMRHLRPRATVVACGMISSYDGDQVAGTEMWSIVSKRLRLQGFIATEHLEHFDRFRAEVSALIDSDRLRHDVNRYEGIESAPRGLIEMLDGSKPPGKSIVVL